MEPNAPVSQQPGLARKDVQHVAALASLALTEDEVERMSRDLGSILDYVAELSGLDTTGIVPLTHVSELWADRSASTALRGDAPASSLDRPRIMEGAPATDGVFFKVPKVIER